MKRILLTLSALLMIGCASAPRSHITPPSVVPIQQGVSRIGVNIDSAKSHADKAKAAINTAEKTAPLNLRDALNRANREVDALTAELLDAKAEVASLDIEANSLAKQVADVTDKANAAVDSNAKITKENTALKAENKAVVQKYHRLKIPLCSLGAACAFLVILRFSSIVMLMGPYGLVAFVLGPAAVFGLLWRWL